MRGNEIRWHERIRGGGGGGSLGTRIKFRKQKTHLPLDSPLSCGNRYAIREGVDTEG